jgi:tRNA-dihydrouridine synthase A
VDQRFFGSHAPIRTRAEILEQFSVYVEHQLAEGVRLNHITRHILGLYSHQPGARKFRRYISENAHLHESTADLIIEAGRLCQTAC